VVAIGPGLEHRDDDASSTTSLAMPRWWLPIRLITSAKICAPWFSTRAAKSRPRVRITHAQEDYGWRYLRWGT
jgi:hypothetical protein